MSPELPCGPAVAVRFRVGNAAQDFAHHAALRGRDFLIQSIEDAHHFLRMFRHASSKARTTNTIPPNVIAPITR
jgi:hypothetical protein